MTHPLLMAAAPALVSEIGQGIRQYLEYRRQRAAAVSQDQAARLAALEEKVADLAKEKTP